MNGKVTEVNKYFKDKITKKEVAELTAFLRSKGEKFITDIGTNNIEIFSSNFLLEHVAKSYLLDVEKYKAFHDFPNKDINKYKVAAYLVKWILKIKPMMHTPHNQGNTDSEKKHSILINELFAFDLACSKVGIEVNSINPDQHERIIYNLHYRDYNVGIFNILLENLK